MTGLLELLVNLLALTGGIALIMRLVRSAGRAMLSAAEVAAATGLAEAGARRGDLTAMSEGGEIARKARIVRRNNLIAALTFFLWLALPLTAGFAAEAYALAAPLWVIRR